MSRGLFLFDVAITYFLENVGANRLQEHQACAWYSIVAPLRNCSGSYLAEPS